VDTNRDTVIIVVASRGGCRISVRGARKQSLRSRGGQYFLGLYILTIFQNPGEAVDPPPPLAPPASAPGSEASKEKGRHTRFVVRLKKYFCCAASLI